MKPMNAERLDRWLTPITNLAVLVGLILIVVELKQNQDTLELEQELALLESQQTDFNALSELRNLVIEDPELTQLMLTGISGEELSETDALRFRYLCQNWFWSAVLMYDRSVRLGRQGYPEATISWMRSTIEAPGLNACWQDTKSFYRLWGFGEFVDAVDAQEQPPSADRPQ